MAKRRGKGEGSIFQRTDGTWCSRIEVGRDAGGKRIRKDVYGKTKKEVQDKLTQLQSQKLTGTLVPNDSTNYGDFLEWWLNDAASLTVRPKTLAWYRQVVETHIKPRLAAVKLQKLTGPHIQTLIADMARDKKSARMRQIVFAVIHRSLVVALRQGMVPRNVADAVDRPTIPKHEIKPLDGDQVAAFLAAAEGDRMEALYVLALSTGMRQGEMFGLEWNDVDLKAGTLTVRRTLVEMNGEFTTSEPKTDRGRRLIELPAIAVDALWAQRALQMTEGLAASSMVFTDTDGKPLRRSNVTRRSFFPLLIKAGLPQIRFHDLRHSSATLLLGAGIHPKVVQERMGHSQISMTMDIYSHCLPSMGREAAGKLDGLLKKKLG